MPTRKRQPKAKPVSQGNVWEQFPQLEHLTGHQRTMMEYRRRHRAVRYGCFRLQTAVMKAEDVAKSCAELPAGFADYWLEQKAKYAVQPGSDGQLEKAEVPAHKKGKTVEQMGGYVTFALFWDIDPNLNVYLRHSSIWQEWNATLMRVVPILGEH